jgi:prolyl oligopeptidase
MKKNIFATYILIAIALQNCSPKQEISEDINVEYPQTRTVEVIDTFFGHEVADPFRWLEDDLSEETASWVSEQNELTQNYLSNIPYRNKIRQVAEKIWNYEKYSAPFKKGEYTYFYKNDGLQNQSVLYRFKGEEAPEVFLDPNQFSEDGTTSLAGINFSKSGKKAAFQLSEGGSDWRKIIVWDAETKTILDDTLKDVKFSGISWRGDEGFYYSSYDKPKGSELSSKTFEHKLYYHVLGQIQNQDKLVFGGSQNPRRYIGGSVTENGKFLIISAANTTTGNELYVADLSKSDSKFVSIVNNFNNSHSVVHADEKFLYVLTNIDAPNKKLIKIDANNPKLENAETLIAENEMPLSVTTGAGKFFALYMKDALSVVLQCNTNGEKEREIELPGQGTASGFGGEWEEEKVYFSFTNYITPGSIFEYNPTEGTQKLYKKPELAFNSDDYETYQVFYASKDGTSVPMMITHKKGLKKDGENPTILYGYGGFNISLTPTFSPAIATWLELGGVYAVANLRGGGEYGKKWHDGGRQLNKQNVFVDFIMAAEYLISNQLTSANKLGISGGSNGGLLVGACMTQRPELFAVALPAVGVLDMLRYHRFTAGAGWAYDYGTAEDSEEMFLYLKGYSPLHNLSKGKNYPATMITTADHDDRVVPAHSFKFAAALQSVNDGPNPTLIRIETKAGHGAGKPTSMLLDEVADKYAFTLFNMGLKKLK